MTAALWSVAGQAQSADDRPRAYVGAFGGIAGTPSQDVRQSGTAYRRGADALPGYRDFDLVVDTTGRTDRGRDAIAGIQLGYRFATTGSRIVPAVEIEGIVLSQRRDATLANGADEGVANIGTGPGQAGLADPTGLIREEYGAGRHRFSNTMRVDTRLLLANVVMGYRLNPILEPYIGAGAGIAVIGMRDAASYQTSPFGPIERIAGTGEAVNHFNSDTGDTRIAFAVQAKVGTTARITRTVSAFVEYRHLRIRATDFTFGATDYAGHPPTDPWRLRTGPAIVHAGVAGLRFAF